jgi:hypothetical protein
MVSAVIIEHDMLSTYFNSLTSDIGTRWNRFWFTPRSPEALAIVRIATGVVALYWYLSYLPVFIPWFGIGGLISPELVASWRGPRTALCVFDWAGNDIGLSILYAMGAISIFLMTIGFRAQVMAVLASVFVISLIQRGPIFARFGDDLLVMMLVYLCFAPSHRCWSLHAYRNVAMSKTKPPVPLFSGLARWRGDTTPIASANLSQRLMQVHFAIILLAILIAQLNSPSWWNGVALWTWVTRVDSRWYNATWIGDQVWLINLWTMSFLVWEAMSALLWWPKLRPLLIGWGVILWGSLAITGGSVMLPAMMVVCSLAFWRQEPEEV